MKKTKYLLITTVLIMLISGVSNINAYNENANDENDESTLDLNTDGLKNKKEDYSSLTKVYPMSRTIKLKGIFLMLKI